MGCTATHWNYQAFEAEVDRGASSIEALEACFQTIWRDTPLRRAWYRFWRTWSPGADCAYELQNFTPAEDGAPEMRALRRHLLDQAVLERLLPVNAMAEIEAGSKIGRIMMQGPGMGWRRTSILIPVHGHDRDAGLFIGDCDCDPAEWDAEFRRAQGPAQLMAQRLHVAIRDLLKDKDGVLSARERQCLEASAQGKTVKAIARDLGLSDQTVTFYLSRVRLKLKVANTKEAVAKAYKCGLLRGH